MTVIKIPTIIEEQGKARPEQKENINMAHIETKKGLNTLLKRVKDYGRKAIKEKGFNLDEFIYWRKCIEGCLQENLAMDEVDYENAPAWFRPLWKGLR